MSSAVLVAIIQAAFAFMGKLLGRQKDNLKNEIRELRGEIEELKSRIRSA